MRSMFMGPTVLRPSRIIKEQNTIKVEKKEMFEEEKVVIKES